MKVTTFCILIIVALASCQKRRPDRLDRPDRGDKNPGARNLVLTEQELRFAGNSLRTVFSTNLNNFVSSQTSDTIFPIYNSQSFFPIIQKKKTKQNKK
jgi:hypothetical protein